MLHRRHLLHTLAISLATIALCLAPTGCKPKGGAANVAMPVQVVVSIPPMRWAFEGLPDEVVRIRVIIPEGQSPHGFEPGIDDVSAIADADVLAGVGLGIDGPVERIAARRGRADRRNVSFQQILGLADAPAHHHDHDHGHDHHHDHGDSDAVNPHVWLDPVHMRQFVEASAGELRSALVARRDAGIEGDWDTWLAQLDAAAAERLAVCDRLDAAYRERLAPWSGQPIITYHNAFQPVADRYGIEIGAVLRPVESVEPTVADFEAALRAVEEHGVSAIFTEPQFSAAGANRLASETGIRVLVLDPLGETAPGGWPRMMSANLETLIKGLEAPSSE